MARPVLLELASLGTFFALDRLDEERAWVSLTQWLGDTAAVTRRVDEVHRVLASGARRPPGDVPRRAAASVTHLGIVARVVSPAIGLNVLRPGDRVPAPQSIALLPDAPTPVPLAMSGSTDGEPGSDDPAARILALAQAPEAAFARQAVPVPVLRGNTASAINTAARLVATARADLTERALDLAAALLASPPLARRSDGAPGAPGWRRRSCCLIYQVADPRPDQRALCGDCVLASRHG